jgi:exoribonuclease R
MEFLKEWALLAGKFQGNIKRLWLCIAGCGDEDIFIPANAINGAMHGDRVIARLSSMLQVGQASGRRNNKHN